MSTIAFLVACHFVLNLYYVITVYSVYGEINMMMMMMMRDIASYWSKIAKFLYPHLYL